MIPDRRMQKVTALEELMKASEEVGGRISSILERINIALEYGPQTKPSKQDEQQQPTEHD